MRSLVAAAALVVATAGAAAPDPFAFFAPSYLVTEKDRRALKGGDSVAHVLPSPKGQVSIFAAVPVDAPPDRLVAWVRAIDRFKRSRQIPISERFSDPPRLDDLAALTFDDDTIDDVRACRVGDCVLKLTEGEITHFQQVITGAGGGWRTALQRPMREMMLERVRAYLEGGHLGMPLISDGSEPISLHERFAAILRSSTFLIDHEPQLAAYLGRYPEPAACRLESFLYWSREDLGRTPSYTVTHVAILRGDGVTDPEVIVVGKQVFATRYFNGSLAVTAIIRDTDGVHRYLTYVNRTDVDLLRWPFAGLFRWYIERHVRSEAPGVLIGVRHRLESGEPGD